MGSIPGSGKSPGGGNSNPLRYSCLTKSHGQRSLASFSPGGRSESNRTEPIGTRVLFGGRCRGFSAHTHHAEGDAARGRWQALRGWCPCRPSGASWEPRTAVCVWGCRREGRGDTGCLRTSLCTGPWDRGNGRPVSLPRSRRRCGTSPRSSTTATRSGCAPSAAGTTSSRCWTSCRRATRGSGTACTAGRRCRSTRSWTPRPACPPCSSSPGRGGRAAEGEAHPAWRSPAGTPGCRDGATPPGGKAASTPVTPALAIPGFPVSWHSAF